MESFQQPNPSQQFVACRNEKAVKYCKQKNMELAYALPFMKSENDDEFRPRVSTWPCNYYQNDFPCSRRPFRDTSNLPEDAKLVIGKPRKQRRNPWGTESYADLIERAIKESAEQRLTLSQIYAWIVANVPYFAEKNDSESSIGWKNSIRHNLSLHNRFLKTRNDVSGKSSYWSLSDINVETSSSTSPVVKEEFDYNRSCQASRNNYSALDDCLVGIPTSSSSTNSFSVPKARYSSPPQYSQYQMSSFSPLHVSQARTLPPPPQTTFQNYPTPTFEMPTYAAMPNYYLNPIFPQQSYQYSFANQSAFGYLPSQRSESIGFISNQTSESIEDFPYIDEYSCVDG